MFDPIPGPNWPPSGSRKRDVYANVYINVNSKAACTRNHRCANNKESALIVAMEVKVMGGIAGN